MSYVNAMNATIEDAGDALRVPIGVRSAGLICGSSSWNVGIVCSRLVFGVGAIDYEGIERTECSHSVIHYLESNNKSWERG